MFRINHRGEGIDDSDSLEGAWEIVQSGQPGRYDVDEIQAGPVSVGAYQPGVGASDTASGRAGRG